MVASRETPTAAGLALSPDALVMLVGPSGSGKSTWAARHFDAHQVLSSDAFRLLVAGDASDQSATADAFRLLHLVARARLRRGLLTVIDATNVTVGARAALLRAAAAADRTVTAVVFDVSLEQCLRQNAMRPDRRVPEEVVRRHHAQLQSTLPGLSGEGYVAVHLLHDADIEAD